MTFPFPGVLPVLRTPEIARRDGATFHGEVPGDRVSATPWAAFTTGRGLLTRAEVDASGVSGGDLLEAAIGNLAARGATWKVEERSGGFLGLGKRPCVLSYTDEFAAEQLLVDGFMRAAHGLLSPKDVRTSKTAFFAPRRGQIRALLAETGDGKPTPFVERELGLAMQAWASAGDQAVIPAMLRRASVVGNTFTVARRFAGEDGPYLPPVENVRLMVLKKSALTYVANGSVAPKRKLANGLFLALGVRDPNGQQTPLPEATLGALGLPFEASLDRMIASIPLLPVLDMGRLSPSQPVMGFRGQGAIDQLASASSLGRLHGALGDPFVVYPYSHVRVAATTGGVPLTAAMLFELIELCDPRQPGVILTRGTPELDLYVVSGGRITGATSVQVR